MYERPIAYGTAIGVGLYGGLMPNHPLQSGEQVVNLSAVEIADSLPQPVKDVARAAVALRSDTMLASGMRIGNNTFLTAGHALLPNQTTTDINCKGLEATAVNPKQKLGSVAFKGVSAAAFLDDKRDYGIVTTAPNSTASANKVPITAVPDRYQSLIGQEVFLVDYQPVKAAPKQEDLRSPDVKIEKKDIGTERDRTTPAIIAGIVIQETGEEMSVVTGIYKDYSAGAPDIVTRRGGSGGALVTKEGKLAGVLITSTEDTLDDNDLHKQYNVVGEVPHHVSNTYEVAGIQKITEQRLAALPAAQPC